MKLITCRLCMGSNRFWPRHRPSRLISGHVMGSDHRASHCLCVLCKNRHLQNQLQSSSELFLTGATSQKKWCLQSRWRNFDPSSRLNIKYSPDFPSTFMPGHGPSRRNYQDQDQDHGLGDGPNSPAPVYLEEGKERVGGIGKTSPDMAECRVGPTTNGGQSVSAKVLLLKN